MNNHSVIFIFTILITFVSTSGVQSSRLSSLLYRDDAIIEAAPIMNEDYDIEEEPIMNEDYVVDEVKEFEEREDIVNEDNIMTMKRKVEEAKLRKEKKVEESRIAERNEIKRREEEALIEQERKEMMRKEEEARKRMLKEEEESRLKLSAVEQRKSQYEGLAKEVSILERHLQAAYRTQQRYRDMVHTISNKHKSYSETDIKRLTRENNDAAKLIDRYEESSKRLAKMKKEL